MIAFISERNRSRRVVLPLFFHANPANVCCFPTRPSLVLLFSSIRQNCVFHSIALSDLCRASLAISDSGFGIRDSGGQAESRIANRHLAESVAKRDNRDEIGRASCRER